MGEGMEIVRGSAVRSRAGRDKGRFFAVLAVQDGAALVADGDLRKLDKPKRKNLRHLAGTNTRFAEPELQSDRLLYSAIRSRFYGDTPSREG